MQDGLICGVSSEVFGGSRRERERFQEVFRQGTGGAAFPEFPKTTAFRSTSNISTIQINPRRRLREKGPKLRLMELFEEES
jgi:hypothetical protein